MLPLPIKVFILIEITQNICYNITTDNSDTIQAVNKMKMYHPGNNEKWLEFTDHSFESPAEEFREVMTILRNGGCEYESKYLLPEQEFYKFTLNGEMFAISTDNFDRKGCTVCTSICLQITLCGIKCPTVINAKHLLFRGQIIIL